MTQQLDKVFNLPEVVIETTPATPTNNDSMTDFELARTNIRKIIDKGDKTLDGILDLAKASEHPRSYEVAGQLIKTLVDANKDLLNIHKFNDGDKKDQSTISVKNAVFVGSTAELQKIIQQERKTE